MGKAGSLGCKPGISSQTAQYRPSHQRRWVKRRTSVDGGSGFSLKQGVLGVGFGVGVGVSML